MDGWLAGRMDGGDGMGWDGMDGLPVCLSVCLSVCLCLAVCGLYDCLFVCMSLCLVGMSVCMYVCISVRMYYVCSHVYTHFM